MRKFFLLIAASLAGQDRMSDLDQTESLQVIGLNQAEANAYRVAFDAEVKFRAAQDNSKAVISRMKTSHHAQRCELDRTSMQWRDCKSIIEKGKK